MPTDPRRLRFFSSVSFFFEVVQDWARRGVESFFLYPLSGGGHFGGKADGTGKLGSWAVCNGSVCGTNDLFTERREWDTIFQAFPREPNANLLGF